MPLPIPDTRARDARAAVARGPSRSSASSIKAHVRERLRAGVPGEGSRARARRTTRTISPPEHRRIAAPAIKRLVRSAWLLDAFGDIGNKQQISDAYTQFVGRRQRGRVGLSTANETRATDCRRRPDPRRRRARRASRGDAHKAITSKYTFNDDVFPIFRERCASCHVERGDRADVADDLRATRFRGPNRSALSSSPAHMPPWNADEGLRRDLKHAHTLTAERARHHPDMGDRRQPAQAISIKRCRRSTLTNDWVMGAPDLRAEAAVGIHRAPPTRWTDSQEFTLPTGTKEARWVRAVDLLARHAVRRPQRDVIVLKGASPSAAAPADQVLALWVPGHACRTARRSGGVQAAGRRRARRARFTTRRRGSSKVKTVTDRSTIGVYFAPERDGAGAPDRADRIAAAAPRRRTRPLTFSARHRQDLQALAHAARRGAGRTSRCW